MEIPSGGNVVRRAWGYSGGRWRGVRFFRRMLYWLFAATSCIAPVDLPAPEAEYQLVVDGAITTAAGPYSVRLYRVRSLLQDLDTYVVERGARVILEDDGGHSEELIETGDGVYQTRSDGIRGEVGRSYRITVVTSRGWTYESGAQVIQPVGTVADVRFQIYSGPRVEGQNTYRVDLTVDAAGVANHTDRLRFRRVGTYQLRTSPELRQMSSGGVVQPDPIPCSGYVYANGSLSRVGGCSCCDCWITETDELPVLFNERLTGLDRFDDVGVGTVTLTPNSIQFGYHVEIQQLSLTAEAYQFWEMIRTQRAGGISALFQPAPARVRGNIHSVNGAPAAMGFFGAYGIATRAVRIEPGDIPGLLPAPTLYPVSCTIFDRSTNVRPSFWPE